MQDWERWNEGAYCLFMALEDRTQTAGYCVGNKRMRGICLIELHQQTIVIVIVINSRDTHLSESPMRHLEITQNLIGPAR
jgi:hypothetical protein